MPRWRLLNGIHVDKDAKPVALVEIEGVERVEGDNTFYKGDIFDSDKLLLRHNVYDCNGNPMSVKFAKLADDAGEGEVDDGLGSMRLDELREYAAAEEIDLGDAKRKDQILAVIRKAAVTA